MRQATVRSYVTSGTAAVPVDVTVSVSDGIGIHMVASLPDTQAKETLLRVTTALMSLGYRIPGRSVTIHIGTPDGLPVTLRASNLDLALATAMILADGRWGDADGCLDGFALVGELALDGSVRRVPSGDIPAHIPERLILPRENARDIARNLTDIPEDRIFGISHLGEVRDVPWDPERYDIRNHDIRHTNK